jgi:hypothetical protein
MRTNLRACRASYGRYAYGCAYCYRAYGRYAYGRYAYGRYAYGRYAYGRYAYGRFAYGRFAYGRAYYHHDDGTWHRHLPFDDDAFFPNCIRGSRQAQLDCCQPQRSHSRRQPCFQMR